MNARRSFGPAVLLGLGSAALAAVAGTKRWAVLEDDAAPGAAAAGLGLTDTGEMPVASALALVVLACWGVLLVTRGPVRRAVAALAALAAAGLLVSVVLGRSQTADDVREAVSGAGVAVAHTGWWWAALAGAVAALGASLLAVRLAPRWPEMGTRYDAPTGEAATTSKPVEEQSNLDLWRRLDEGDDPTA